MGKSNGNNSMNSQKDSLFINNKTKNKFSALFDDNDDDTNNDTLYKPPIKKNNSENINEHKPFDNEHKPFNNVHKPFNNEHKPFNNDDDNDFLEVKKSKSNYKKNVRIISYVPKKSLNEVIHDLNNNDDNDNTNDNANNNDNTQDTEINNGSDIILPSLWQLYGHNSESKNWNIDSYNNIYKIINASNLWKFLNNFYRMDFKMYDFFLMKEDILPIWEHKKNRDGSICSIRTDINNGSDAVCLIMLHMVTNKLYTDGSDDINGISCSVRNNWMVIKIWCGFKEDKLTNLLQDGLLSKLNNLTFKHISTVPQY
jgi:hypothetical protein